MRWMIHNDVSRSEEEKGKKFRMTIVVGFVANHHKLCLNFLVSHVFFIRHDVARD